MLFRSSQSPRGAQTEISTAFAEFCHNLIMTAMPKITYLSLGSEGLLKKGLKALDYEPQTGWMKAFVLFYRFRHSLWRARIQLIRWEKGQILKWACQSVATSLHQTRTTSQSRHSTMVRLRFTVCKSVYYRITILLKWEFTKNSVII